MSTVTVSRPRVEVFRLLIYGGDDNVPLTAASIAKVLDFSRSTVHDHIKGLIKEGYIEEIKGTKRPKLYDRGPNGSLLDELIRVGSVPNVRSSLSRGLTNEESPSETVARKIDRPGRGSAHQRPLHLPGPQGR